MEQNSVIKENMENGNVEIEGEPSCEEIARREKVRHIYTVYSIFILNVSTVYIFKRMCLEYKDYCLLVNMSTSLAPSLICYIPGTVARRIYASSGGRGGGQWRDKESSEILVCGKVTINHNIYYKIKSMYTINNLCMQSTIPQNNHSRGV